jgi:hypothetical protein
MNPGQKKLLCQQRIRMAREALIETGYFRADQVGDDIAPRIVELTAGLRQQPRTVWIATYEVEHKPSSVVGVSASLAGAQQQCRDDFRSHELAWTGRGSDYRFAVADSFHKCWYWVRKMEVGK